MLYLDHVITAVKALELVHDGRPPRAVLTLLCVRLEDRKPLVAVRIIEPRAADVDACPHGQIICGWASDVLKACDDP